MALQCEENDRFLPHEAPLAVRDAELAPPFNSQRMTHDAPSLGREKDGNILRGARQALARPLKSSKTGFLLIFFYTFFVVFSWVCTCILAHRPFTTGQNKWKTSFEMTRGDYGCSVVNNQGGQMWGCSGDTYKLPLSAAQRASNRRWKLTLQAISAVMAVLAIPISSAICARAAVAYTQIKRSLNLRQTLALADRGWWDPFILSRLVLPGGLGRYGTPFLVFAAIVCVLGAVAWPMQQVLVNDMTILLVPGVNDTGPDLLAYDADIIGMSQVSVDSVVRDTKSMFETGTHWDQQPQLWQEPSMMCNSTTTDFTEWCYDSFNGHNNQTDIVTLPGDKYWTSNLVKTANTGIVKQHSIRLNSSLDCHVVPETDYPKACDGFETSSMTQIPDPGGSTENRTFEFRVCAPKSSRPFPWNLTRDRQDITDQIFVSLNSDGLAYLSHSNRSDSTLSLTLECLSETTTGYLTLPNKFDYPLPGPLLDKFNLTAAADFKQYINNDSTDGYTNDGPSLDKPNRVPSPVTNPIQSPLTLSILSLFGPDTFFSTRANSTFTNITEANNTEVCTDPVPLSSLLWDNFERAYELPLCANTTEDTHFAELSQWLRVFLNAKPRTPTSYSIQETANETISTALRAGIIYAEQSILSQAAAQPVWHRTLLQSEGIQFRKPSISTASMIMISAVLALHLTGLWLLAIFAITVPTWTMSLDSWALIRMGAAISKDEHAELPLLANIPADEAEVLDHTDGWVGEAEAEKKMRNDSSSRSRLGEDHTSPSSATSSPDAFPRIVIGGSKPLRRGTAYAMFRSEIVEYGLSVSLAKGSWKFVKDKYRTFYARK